MTDDLRTALDYIPASDLDYQGWLNVGMALKHEGYAVSDWDNWSQNDSRYVPGECEKKWDGFHGSSAPVTGATIFSMAFEYGYRKSHEDRALEWDDTISDEYVVIDHHGVEERELIAPTDAWDGVSDLIRFIETLFHPDEYVGYVSKSFENSEKKKLPTQGSYNRTAGELLADLRKHRDDIGAAIGDYDQEAGAWFRINPLNGLGVKDDNVTDFRYALVESDSESIEKQYAIYKELELPVATLVHSGNKSIHAIVRVDAASKEEHRQRTEYLYKICEKNGLKIDKQNRNPSRLSRMPGVIRNGNKQYLIETNIGKSNWADWYEWIEGLNDDLPDPETLEGVWDSLPPLAAPLIDGVLRQGHKMLIAGPSKAGKSFALIQLSIAIAEGRSWFGWPCAKGRVLYVNLELDRASCLHRFRDVYESMGAKPENISSIDIWNLRGKSIPMDKLAPKLIRRAHKKGYLAVIIDPIYKVITGDENSADQMAHFANQFDKICTELGSAVIYCHHHSKGYQGSKRAMDRASGSGVFARDPDCLIDLTELEMTEGVKVQVENRAVAAHIDAVLREKAREYYEENVSVDDVFSKAQMTGHAQNALTKEQNEQLKAQIQAIVKPLQNLSVWRIEGTLREFPRFAPVDLYFKYPIHEVDKSGILKDLEPEEAKPAWQKAAEARKPKEKKLEERMNAFEETFDELFDGENEVTLKELAEEMGVSMRTIKRRIEEHPGYEVQNNGRMQLATVVKK